MIAPAIVLVRPQLGENIGKAARAMLNFGLTDLRLVAPRDGWPNPSAGPAASGADEVLANAQVYNSIYEAVADCVYIFATTARKRSLRKPVSCPEAAVAKIRSQAGRSAILFGAERSGLESDDVALARTIISIPVNPSFTSLNLAQAVIVLAYEWLKAEGFSQPTITVPDPPAAQAELDGLVERLLDMLDDAGYFFPPERKSTARRTVRSLLTKPAWNAQEVRTMRGILTTLWRHRHERE